MRRNSFIIRSFLTIFSFFFPLSGTASYSAAKITEPVSSPSFNATTDALSLSGQTVFSAHPPTINTQKPHIGAITPNLSESVTLHTLYLIHHDRVIDRICHYNALGFTVDPKNIAGTTARNADELLQGATQVRGRFPRTGQPNQVLVRRGSDGRATHYQVYDADGLPVQRVDLTGRAHGGVDTPHVVEFQRNVNPETGEVFVRPNSTVRPALPEEIP